MRAVILSSIGAVAVILAGFAPAPGPVAVRREIAVTFDDLRSNG